MPGRDRASRAGEGTPSAHVTPSLNPSPRKSLPSGEGLGVRRRRSPAGSIASLRSPPIPPATVLGTTCDDRRYYRPPFSGCAMESISSWVLQRIVSPWTFCPQNGLFDTSMLTRSPFFRCWSRLCNIFRRSRQGTRTEGHVRTRNRRMFKVILLCYLRLEGIKVGCLTSSTTSSTTAGWKERTTLLRPSM